MVDEATLTRRRCGGLKAGQVPFGDEFYIERNGSLSRETARSC